MECRRWERKLACTYTSYVFPALNFFHTFTRENITCVCVCVCVCVYMCRNATFTAKGVWTIWKTIICRRRVQINPCQDAQAKTCNFACVGCFILLHCCHQWCWWIMWYGSNIRITLIEFHCLVIYCFHLFAGSDPSVVVLPGTLVNVSCWCPGSFTSLIFGDLYIYTKNQTATQAILDERGITVLSYSVDAFSGYTVSTNATNLSNGTFFDCLSASGSSPRVYIYALYGKLIYVNSYVATSSDCFPLCRSSLSTRTTQFVCTEFHHTQHLLVCSMVPPCW